MFCFVLVGMPNTVVPDEDDHKGVQLDVLSSQFSPHPQTHAADVAYIR